MFYLIYKFFKESTQLTGYILSYYLSNVVIITFLQLLFFLFVYNFFEKLKTKIKETTKNYLVQNNTTLIKNILITYHQEQIKFITKLFNNKIVQQLFPDIAPNETCKNIFFQNAKDNVSISADINNNNVNSNGEQMNKSNSKTAYPKLPESPKENNT